MSMQRSIVVVAGAFAIAASACSRPAVVPLTNTATPARTVAFSETVFGVPVSDPYRWMEDPANASSMTDWVRSATAANMKQVAMLPGRNRLRDALLTASQAGVSYRDVKESGGRLFALRLDPDATVHKLVMREGGIPEKVLFDPAAGPKPATIDTYMPSPRDTLVAVHTAEGGGEIGPIRFLDVATGAWRDDAIAPVWGEFYVVWLDEATALFTRMGDGVGNDALRTMRAGIHHIGRPASEDAIVLAPPPLVPGAVTPTEMPLMWSPFGSPWVIGAFVGAAPDARVMVAPARDVRAGHVNWRAVASYDDRVNSYDVFGDGIFLVTTKHAPKGELRRADAAKGTASTAEVVLPASERVLTSVASARDGLYVVTLKDGVNGVLFLPQGKPPAREVALEPATIGSGWLTSDGRGLTLGVTTWTRNVRFFRLEGGVARETGVASASYAGAEKVEATMSEAVSADGTHVPLTVLGLKGREKTGRAPTLLEAYGGYGIPFSPDYSSVAFPWIERGGLIAVCGVRGGGEKGRAWHEAGRGANKPNGHADLIACAEQLVKSKDTDAAHLAVTGTSAGGMLVPPAALKRPDLFTVVLSRVGVVNPTRLAVAENGPNQFREVGDPQTEAGFKGLVAQDAYLMLDKATTMPDWFITVGLNDHRVAPWMNAKLAARAMAKPEKRSLVFIRADADAGHGVGSTRTQTAEEWADAYSFLLNRFGDPDYQLPPN
jgi:prolyl oligopeptidase